MQVYYIIWLHNHLHLKPWLIIILLIKESRMFESQSSRLTLVAWSLNLVVPALTLEVLRPNLVVPALTLEVLRPNLVVSALTLEVLRPNPAGSALSLVPIKLVGEGGLDVLRLRWCVVPHQAWVSLGLNTVQLQVQPLAGVGRLVPPGVGQDTTEGHDVAEGHLEGLVFGQRLVLAPLGHHLAQAVEGRVQALHSLPLPGVGRHPAPGHRLELLRTAAVHLRAGVAAAGQSGLHGAFPSGVPSPNCGKLRNVSTFPKKQSFPLGEALLISFSCWTRCLLALSAGWQIRGGPDAWGVLKVRAWAICDAEDSGVLLLL